MFSVRRTLFPLARSAARSPLSALCALALLAGATGSARAHEAAVIIPAPAVDERGDGPVEKAVVAGGCFWGVQGVFQHVKGVTNAVSGYAGGSAETAHYEVVGSGLTGHAESVEITFNPAEISYGQILQIFFSVVHDPTQLNRQGPDTGPQYRSAIFPANDAQKRVALSYIAQLDQAKVFPKPIVTKTDDLTAFFPAEGYHQDFLVRNPRYPYIVINDLPKVENFKRVFAALYREMPVLVAKPKS
jgi:peptide-methionine (S)-S-oxide reductase